MASDAEMSFLITGVRAEQRTEAFLLKVSIIGKSVGQPFPAHGLHRNAIGQTVTLVRAVAIKLHASQERLMALSDDDNLATVEKRGDQIARLFTHTAARPGK